MIARLMRRLTTADAMGLIFVILALLIFAYGISSSLRETDTNGFYWICIAAATISFWLGRGRWNGVQASAGMAALGIGLVWILGARLTGPLLDLIEAGFSLLPQFVPVIRYGEVIDTSAILEAWGVIAQASLALWARLQTWMLGFDRSVTINDSLIRNMVWALILWLCAAWMGWFAEKREAAVCFLPSLALLAAVTSYSERRFDSLWMMVLLLLLLMGIWNYRNHTLQWIKRRIDYSDSIRTDNSQAVIILTLAIGTFAFITPSISWRDIMDTVRELRDENEAAEMLGIQEPRGSGGAGSAQEPSLPRDHLLSGGNANSEQVVMTIRTGELPPIPNPAMIVNAPRYYWRSAVYDEYVGAGWITGMVSRQTISANTPLIPGLLSGYRLVHLDVRMVEPEGRLFWSGVLFSTDIPFNAEWRVRPPSDLFADQSALLQTDMFAASTNAETYQAETYIPVPTVNDLRSAGADYPEGIRDRYLPLPRSVPERVHDLARQITDGLVNPYERAKAIEVYLRANYPYDLEVPAPPEGRDVADYFLFDLQKGYCDYYATAMVVLARSSGLPARFVSGYSPGAYDAPNAQYIVRELNAHSWAEVYFPDVGWVEFEPTASLPEIERANAPLPMSSDQGDEENASELLTRFRLERILLWSSPVLVLLIFAILYFAFIERWLVLRLYPEAAIENVYQRFYRAGRPLAGAWTSTETSSEFLHKFMHGMNKVQSRGHFKRLQENINKNAIQLTDVYHASLFTRHRTQKDDAVVAWMIWKRLRRWLFIYVAASRRDSSLRSE
jgi:transglutaminase-like putative cysteine protease